MSEAETVSSLLEHGAADAPAILAPERPALSYGALRALVGDTVKTLNALGIGRDDRVAIVLPNGPEMATAFVAIAAGATTAPLNPAYRAEEFEFYLSDLDAKALIVEAGIDSPALEVARARAIPILTLTPTHGRAGRRLRRSARRRGRARPARRRIRPSPTTSRWCCTPRARRRGRRSCRSRQRNVCASARNIAHDAGTAPRPTAASTSCRCSTSTA